MRQMFFPMVMIPVLALAACGGPEIPESGAQAGVGFGDYQSYLKQREAALTNGGAAPAPMGTATVANAGAAIGAEAVATTSLGSTSPSAPLPASILAAVPGGPMGQTPAPVQPVGQPLGAPLTTSSTLGTVSNSSAAPMAPPPVTHSAGISDENSFDAVAGRETIASDKERLAQMRANYQQVTPTALPSRSGDAGINLASYALSANNTLGQSVYARGGMHLTSSERACGKFASPDLAQRAFLQAGGPQKDSKNLDPDGDGFACSWDPRPFQAARAQ